MLATPWGKAILLGRAGAAAPVLPSGAIGVWYAADYDATGHPRLPNSLTPSANPGNLLAGAGSRRILSQAPWAVSNCTVTDGQTGPDGKAEAARIFSGSSTNWVHRTPVTLPNSQLTVAAYVKSNTGSSQDFRMSIGGSAFSSNKTATTSWQRFSFTATPSAGVGDVVAVRTISGNSAIDILICDVELYAGASDLGPQVYTSGDIYLGRNAFDNIVTYSNGRLTVADTNSLGLLLMPGDARTVTAFTAIVIGRQTAVGSGGNFFRKIPTPNDYRAYISKATPLTVVAPAVQWSSTQYDYGDGGLWSLNGFGDHMIAHVWDGATYSSWLDDSKLYNGTLSSPPSISLQNLQLGGSSAYFEIDAVALWDRALTDAEVRAAYAVMRVRLALASITISSTPTRILVTEGDSLTYSVNSYVYQSVLSPTVLGNNVAISGSRLQTNSNDLVQRAAFLVDSAIPLNKAGRQYVLSIFVGQNDLTDATQYAADLATYIANRRAAGYDKVVLCTLLTRTDGGSYATHPAFRNAVNAIIKGVGWAAAHGVDAIADFAADATMGTDTSPNDATYFLGDKVHPTTAGYLILAGIWQAAVNGL